MNLQSLPQPPRLRGGKRLVQGPTRVGIQVVADQDQTLRLRIVLIQELLDAPRPFDLATLRRVWITPQRRKVEWAWCVKQLLDESYPQVERLVLICDNLNTHTGGALYEAFPAAEARRLWERLEVHYTPKHGSWLNMAETELSVLSGGRRAWPR